MTVRTRIKVCGVRRSEDAVTAAGFGVDALGFNFWPASRRFLEPEMVPGITRVLPPMITSVAVVVDPAPDELDYIVRRAEVDVVQFHGDEPREYCEDCGRPYIKSVRVRSPEDVHRALDAHPNSKALLLDAYKQGMPGGTGESFDWSLIPDTRGKPIILAGGLSAENVGTAIRATSPYAVDVSSGVERDAGVKDRAKIQAFVREVNRATASE